LEGRVVYRKSIFFLLLGSAVAIGACKAEVSDDTTPGNTGATGGTAGSGSPPATGGTSTSGAGGTATAGTAGSATSGSGPVGGIDAGGAGGEDGTDVDAVTDDDGDTISNADEDSADSRDTDGDATPDYLDLDSDGDGIPDSIEAGDDKLSTPPIDTDGDGTPDYLDLDSDDDGIPDATEIAKGFDSDGDLIPDFRDDDSDNDDVPDKIEKKSGLDPRNPDTDGDTISDGDEGLVDSDGDGIINALDDDSDDDGIPDKDEAGDKSVDTPPVDTDFDGTPDFLDLDSDGDGLPDEEEARCGRGVLDGDGDGYSDLAEVSIGSDPCDPNDTVRDHGVEFFFVLPYKAAEQKETLRFVPTVKKADVFFNVDTTGSMTGVISSLKSGLDTVITATRARVSDSGFGVASFEDYPVYPYGSTGDEPFHLFSGETGNATDAQAATDMLALGGGSDGPEAGYEALFQVADGSGIDGAGGTFGPFKKAGRIGGAQFRPSALPIVVHATDAPGHDLVATAGNDAYPTNFNAHGRVAALGALQGIGARVITIQNGSATDTTTQLTEISEVTRAVVPSCSFKTSETAWRCGTNQCCLPNATAPTTDDDGNPVCILRYQINNDGSGLADVAADGIDAIIKYTKFDVYAATRDDGDSATPDTSAFVGKVEANSPDDDFKPPLEPEFSCNPVPKPAKFKSADYDNGFTGFAVGSSSADREGANLFFSVHARNTTVKETAEPQMFRSYIDIVDDQTGTVLDTQDVVVIVPALPGGVGE
jgi:hypothetical protein